MIRTIAALCCLLMTLLAGAARAQSGAKHLALEPAVEQARAGEAFDIALVFRPEPGWHGYWGENPGDAGFPPKLSWTAPAGTRIDAPRWPVPATLLIGGLMNYVYEAPFAALVRVQPPAGHNMQTLRLHAQYLVCTDKICVPEEQEITIRLPGAAGSNRAVLDGWRAALPKPLGSAATYQVADGRLRLAVPYPAAAALQDAYFFPTTRDAVRYAAPQRVRRDGDRLLIEAEGTPTGPIEGVLRVRDGRGLRVRADPGVVPGADGAWGAALAAFGLAVLGGLILNVMPCVFPILSLKALSLARSGGSERHARGEALAYTAGVVLVCVGLGAAILLLRAGGAAAGWGFQLQDPRIIAVLLALSIAIAANLSGLWEVPSLSFERAGGAPGAFATGALAAFVATPCTGPFMAAALGAALVLPWFASLAVFAGLGLGLALPFLLIGFVPALRRLLPRPGMWMERVRRVLAVPMWLTAAALGWLLGRTALSGDMLAFGVAAIVLALLAVAGRRQRQGQSAGVLLAATLIAVPIAAVAAARSLPAAARQSAGSMFSEARLAQLRASGKPVFAYFTADWCLTCKVNERVAIEPAQDDLRRKGIQVLVGDWTDGDPALGRFIEAHGRAGVPLYLYYPAGQEARVLPQVLTPGMLKGL